MPRKPCYWTRKLELDLVDFVRQRDFIWKPIGNTNHHIQQKYKAYAEFAAKLGRGFTARSVRDRWVNIRSTFNHNLRRVDKSKEKAKSEADVYVPCWPLWKPLQFLKCVARREGSFEDYSLLQHQPDFTDLSNLQVKEEFTSDIDLMVRQNDQRTDRPRRKMKIKTNKETTYDESGLLMIRRGQRKDIPRKSKITNNKCMRVIDDLVRAMKPLTDNPLLNLSTSEQSYWFFGKHVTERLNSMRDVNAECASREIINILDEVELNADDIIEMNLP